MPELTIGLLLRLAVCFALGSIPFAVISMWGTGVDITRFGSGNPGFNNVLRYSKWRSALCLAGDAGKGLVAVWACSQPGDGPLPGWIFGFLAVLGHAFSPFLAFRGGKGIATGAGEGGVTPNGRRPLGRRAIRWCVCGECVAATRGRG